MGVYQSISTPVSASSLCCGSSHPTWSEAISGVNDGVNPSEMQASLTTIAESLQRAALVLRNLKLESSDLPNIKASVHEDSKFSTSRTRARSVSGAFQRLPKISGIKAPIGTCPKSHNTFLWPSFTPAGSAATFANADFHIRDENGNLLLEETVQQLVHANRSLRQAFNEASQRILLLEDDKFRFCDEAIFDIVNSAVTR